MEEQLLPSAEGPKEAEAACGRFCFPWSCWFISIVIGLLSAHAVALRNVNVAGGGGDKWSSQKEELMPTNLSLSMRSNPQWHPWAVGPSAAYYSFRRRSWVWVSDLDGLLSQTAIEKLKDTVAEVASTTKYELAVLVLDRVAGPCDAPLCPEGMAVMQSFATDVLDKWYIGDGTKGPGVLLFLSRQLQMVYIRTENQTHPLLSDSCCTGIVTDYMAPFLRKNELDAGVLAGTNRLRSILQGQESCESGGVVAYLVDFVHEVVQKVKFSFAMTVRMIAAAEED